MRNNSRTDLFSRTWQEATAVEIFPGIRRRILYKEDSGRHALILEIDPGAKWPEDDIHEPGSEEVFVVQGIFNDGVKDYGPGTFIHSPKGSKHVPQSKTGCVLFVFFPEG